MLVNFKFELNGVNVQDGPSPFYVLNTMTLAPREHSLKVTAYNPVSSAERTFNLYKNTPPTVTLTNNSSTSISCAGGSFMMQALAEDFDQDEITFSFLVDGVTNVPGSTGSVSGPLASHTYSPPGWTVQGVKQVTIRATDSRGGYTDRKVAVTVNNPNIADITSYSPVGDPTNSPSSNHTESNPDAYASPGKPINNQPLISVACALKAVTQLPR